MRRAGGKGRLVGCEVESESGYFSGIAQATHRLARRKALPCGFFIAAQCTHALGKRRRFHRAWADRVTADTARYVIGGDRAGQADDGGLGRAVSKAIRYALDARCN